MELFADTEEWKMMTSPDYPTPYCNSLYCTYQIKAPENHQIVVNITGESPSIEPHSFLDFFTEIDQDFLAFFNGNNTNGTHIELYAFSLNIGRIGDSRKVPERVLKNTFWATF